MAAPSYHQLQMIHINPEFNATGSTCPRIASIIGWHGKSEQVDRNTTTGFSMGMGVVAGVVIGMILFPENFALGIPIGMALGFGMGQAVNARRTEDE